MTRFSRILGIALAATAIVCFGISIFRQDRLFLPVGLLCNSLALLVFLYAQKKKSK